MMCVLRDCERRAPRFTPEETDITLLVSPTLGLGNFLYTNNNISLMNAGDVGEIEIIELKTPTYKQSSEARDLSGLSNTATASRFSCRCDSLRFIQSKREKCVYSK